MKTNIFVRDAMTKRPVVARPNTSILECAKIMKKYNVGSLLIKDDNDELVGIVTEEDFVQRVIANKVDVNEPIHKVMTKSVFTIDESEDIFDAIMKMKDLDIRHLPVVSEDGKLKGLITMKDILRLEPQLFDLIVDIIELREEEDKFAALRNKGL
ncbi:MAG: hypothetical protein PWP03_85 [Candidatus Woesearchaeota archaeon]|nr:hypothetical protein [Candidatus Woesearchaeota archaeon]MDN5327447.1 hypothetical protein [Candidatus Woesearchaeota archaeon]